MPTKMLSPEEVEAIRARRPFKTDYLIGYITKGGTYSLSSNGKWNDSGKPRDLLAILPGDIGQGQVLTLYIAVSPELIAEVEAALA